MNKLEAAASVLCVSLGPGSALGAQFNKALAVVQPLESAKPKSHRVQSRNGILVAVLYQEMPF